jgi:hypothetical protein
MGEDGIMSLTERLLSPELRSLADRLSHPGRELELLDELANCPLPALLALCKQQPPLSIMAILKVRDTVNLADTLETFRTQGLNSVGLELVPSSAKHLVEIARQVAAVIEPMTVIAPSLEHLSRLTSRDRIELEELLKELSRCKVSRLMGCARTGLETVATAQGIVPTIQIDASSLLDHLHLARGPRDLEDKGEDIPLLLTRFATQVIELHEELGVESAFRCQIMHCDRRFTLITPMATPLVRVVALMRVVLPSPTVEIEAAANYFGKHLSGVLAQLGLTSPGFTYIGEV